jgi:hypothetical protein
MVRKELRLLEIVVRRAFRGADSSAATQAAAWRYEPSPGILLNHAHPDHERQMQRAHTLRERGHEVRLLSVCDDFIQRILDAAVTRYERS